MGGHEGLKGSEAGPGTCELDGHQGAQGLGQGLGGDHGVASEVGAIRVYGCGGSPGLGGLMEDPLARDRTSSLTLGVMRPYGVGCFLAEGSCWVLHGESTVEGLQEEAHQRWAVTPR